MQINKLELYQYDLRLGTPLGIASHTIPSYQGFYLRLISGDRVSGWGEAAPLKEITGDSLSEALNEAQDFAKLLPFKVDSPAELHSEILKKFKCASFKAAADLALHDLIARHGDIPVFRIFANEPRAVPNSVTVFLKSDDLESSQETHRILTQYPDLTVLKIKLHGRDDVERCRAIKQSSKPGLKFILDANQGYNDVDKACSALEEIITSLGEVLLLEEPFGKSDYLKMRSLRDRIDVPIFADESCTSLHDLQKLIDHDCVDGINIKLQKAGGLEIGRALAKQAEQARLAVMVGQMFETSLSTAAGVALACTAPNVTLSDLDMDLEIPDFCEGKAEFTNGMRRPLIVPGFGFSLKEKTILELSSSGELTLEKLI